MHPAPCAPTNNVAPFNDNNNGINSDGATSNDMTKSANTGRQTQALGPFVDAAGRICLTDHANGLISLLQPAKGTWPGGIYAALGGP
jgi:hypothetical protein